MLSSFWHGTCFILSVTRCRHYTELVTRNKRVVITFLVG